MTLDLHFTTQDLTGSVEESVVRAVRNADADVVVITAVQASRFYEQVVRLGLGYPRFLRRGDLMLWEGVLVQVAR